MYLTEVNNINLRLQKFNLNVAGTLIVILTALFESCRKAELI